MHAKPHSKTAPGCLWGGRFKESVAEEMLVFGASLPVDKRLWREDIQGSKAHARMLGAQGIIPKIDSESIVAGLDSIEADIEAGNWEFFDLADEDIHMNIERELTRRIGEPGGRLHTGRSRNDQVATDTRLYCKRRTLELASKINLLRAVLIMCAQESCAPGDEIVMPGYTHMQKAQPILFAHHLMAYQWSLARDFTRFMAAYQAADVLPLGAAALAGTTYPIDETLVMQELGFGTISSNSLDAVSDRDFVCDAVYASSMAMVHLSRLCEELILWSTEEFGFITLDDAYSTGSSIMPQKKNPDFAELTRGKTGRVIGDLVSLLVMLKALPLAYNKDIQEDKEQAFDAMDTLDACLDAVIGMVETMEVNKDTMAQGAQGGFMAATDLADHLAVQGVPFREAHEVIGRIVLQCEAAGKSLQELSLGELKAFDPRFGDEVCTLLEINSVVARRTTFGGTAIESVLAQIGRAVEVLMANDDVLFDCQGALQ